MYCNIFHVLFTCAK